MNAGLKILVVDDNPESLMLLEHFLSRLGHRVIPARSGREAIERYTADPPDFVLLDVNMPEMNGYETAERIRAIDTPHWVPIVFVSALNQDEDIVKGLAVGGDDYLTKPVKFNMLHAKINSMRRIALLQHRLADYAAELEQHRERDNEEQRISGHVMQRLVDHPGLHDPQIDFRLFPAQQFSGDLVAAARTPDGVLHLLLADATGHGLAAALNVLPLNQVFYSMTKRGFGIGAIAAEMNRKIRVLMPVDRFASAALAAVDARNCEIRVWSGGLPDVLYVNQNGAVEKTFESRHPPLGLVDGASFQEQPEIFHWHSAGQLFLYSDGLPETENSSGEPFGAERLATALATAPSEQRLDQLIQALDRHRMEHALHDDVSMLMAHIPCQCDKPPVMPPAVHVTTTPSSGNWHVDVRLSMQELKYIDPLPLLFGAIEHLHDIKPHRNSVFLILVELFNNAVDHGLLGLDSQLKLEPNGFEHYLCLRQEKLQTLRSGTIELRLERTLVEHRGHIKIRVTDSGAGFDHAARLSAGIADHTKPSGRGIALVRSLCSEVRYVGRGNEVVAYFPLV